MANLEQMKRQRKVIPAHETIYINVSKISKTIMRSSIDHR